ncbi:hypothetical protein [Steroidobacter denitrificans]|uniref:hypothetical protein n=1 Tax=Steroidobacter denitrificans TaxID=465721 RepID=UPI001F163FF6|nr:hypothetical protein [Steroidobacter denitrificans]
MVSVMSVSPCTFRRFTFTAFISSRAFSTIDTTSGVPLCLARLRATAELVAAGLDAADLAAADLAAVDLVAVDLIAVDLVVVDLAAAVEVRAAELRRAAGAAASPIGFPESCFFGAALPDTCFSRVFFPDVFPDAALPRTTAPDAVFPREDFLAAGRVAGAWASSAARRTVLALFAVMVTLLIVLVLFSRSWSPCSSWG